MARRHLPKTAGDNAKDMVGTVRSSPPPSVGGRTVPGTLGNAALLRMTERRPGHSAHDHHEREAERAATAALRGPSVHHDMPAPAGADDRPGLAPTPLAQVLGSSGRPLEPRVRALMEPRFGSDFSAVRVYDDPRSAASARSLNATAYTMGSRIVFSPGAYAPHTASGRRLLAHELAHVVQQRHARRGPQGPASTLSEAPPGIQCYYEEGPTGRTDPNAIIPLDDFIDYVEAVEQAYPDDDREEILTRIRTEYYSGLAFERLIPGAPYLEVVGTRRVFNRQTGEAYETPITRERRLQESRIGSTAYEHLTARADENARGDNPSPYIELPNGEKIDVGHLLLGLDALVHPTTSAPYTSYSIPNIDPSSWVADLGIASVWMTVHQETGSPHDDVVNPPSSPDLDVYYQKSAPEEDLLADVDSFGLHEQWQASPNQPLSQLIRAYYSGSGANTRQRRFQIFCAENNLGYTVSNGTVTWDSGLRGQLVDRIDRFNDLYAAGYLGTAWGAVFGPSRRTWPHTPDVVDKFLDWVKTHLERELAVSGP